MLDLRKQLSITLTEPVVFLRTSDPSGRLQSDPNDSPTLVRGILTLNVAKPIGISSIEVELTGVLAITHQEGIGARRVEYPEKRKTYSSTVTVFRAEQVPRGRNSISVGPGLSVTDSNRNEHAASTSLRPPSLPRGRSERRCVASTHSGTLLPTNVNLERLGPTPPYTVAHPPIPVQPRLDVPGEHRAQTLEELGETLGDDVERQAYPNDYIPVSSPPHFAFSLSSPSVHSITSNESFHRENDNRTDDLVHTRSPLDDTSFHNSTEESPHVLPQGDPPPTHPTRAHSPENSHVIQPRTCGHNRDSSNAPASHSRLRLSITSVLDAVREITSRTPPRSCSTARPEDRERGRPRIRIVNEEQSEVEVGEGVAGSQRGPNPSHLSDHHAEHYLLGLGRVLGLERDNEKEKDGEQKSKEHAESWREFMPGTYSYPISFLLPPDLPPTFSLPYGSLSYNIKGVAHRPGTFTSKLSCQVPLLVVTALAVGTGEGGGAGDPGSVLVQKQWQEKLAYSFGLSSRLFLLGSERRLQAAASRGVSASTESLVEAAVQARAEAVYGTATLDLTLMPTEKVKIWKLDVVIDQRIKYVDERGKPVRDDDKRLVRLLEVRDTCTAEEEEMDLMDQEEQKQKNKHKHKHDSVQIPLLPTPISPHRSPLLRYLAPSTDPSILAGPGPYPLSAIIGLPGCNCPSDDDSSPLHFTVKQKSSSVKVEHSLRVVMRVEPVNDEDTNDHEGGERKRLFEIAVQTPITILSCRCVPEDQTLPEYSQVTEDSLQDCVACPCHTSRGSVGRAEQERGHQGHAVTPSSASSFESEHGPIDEQRSGHDRSRSSSFAGSNGHANSFIIALHPPSPSLANNWTRERGWSGSPHHAETHSRSHSVRTSHVRAHSQDPPHTSRPPSPLARYERLVSGLESEAGEAPPSYESVTSGP